MKALTRERLLERLRDTSSLIDRYRRQEPDFPDRVVAWMGEVETMLLQLRHPMASLAASQRGLILAAADGLHDPRIAPKTRARKRVRITATLALDAVEAALRDTVHSLDDELERWREKMAQLVAVATAERPIPLPPTEPRERWLDQVWRGLDVNAATHGMHSYLGARLSASDRNYLLDEILLHALAQPTE